MPSGECVGQNRERHSQHGCPCTSDKQEGYKQHVLVVNKKNGYEKYKEND